MKLYNADVFSILPTLESESFDAVITDPPYCSGGGSVKRNPTGNNNNRYINDGTKFPDMDDGARDQMAHYQWTVDWMRQCYRLIKHGGWLMAFSDWRMLPVTCTAIQNAGYIWQGINIWHKPNTRPNLGRFFRGDEFIILGTKGSPPGGMFQKELRKSYEQVWTGMLSPKERNHVTSKPIALMEHLMQVVPPNGTILDPFMGGGSTLVAALRTGRHAVGIEKVEPIYRAAEERLKQ